MLNKILLYSSIVYKGELLKRTEYKIKDLIGYFYIRNRISLKENCSKLEIPRFDDITKKTTKEDSFSIFNDIVSYNELDSKIVKTNLFWRKYKLNQFNDIKTIWEVNRLQFLLPLSVNHKYKKLSVDLIDKWLKCNKYEYSINWTNNLEVAIRAINIFLYLVIMNDAKLTDKYSRILELHANYIYNEINYSKYCIPNNHLIGEAVALLIMGNVFDNKKWIKKSIKLLYKFKNVIQDDGVSVENSISYQFFVTKMYILALPFISDKILYDLLYNKVSKSLQILNMATINDNIYPNYGDNDGGYLFSFDNKYELGKDIKRYYDMFFHNKSDYETSVIRGLFTYFNKSITNINDDIGNCFYNDSIFIYRKNNNLLFFNAKNIMGHAHNDSLAINLFIDGKEVIYDSGTYCYNYDKKKREYYVSRLAHSTVLFDDVNAIHVTTFRWKNINKSYILNVSTDNDVISVSGIIEGICKRTIIIDKKKISVIDESLNDKLITSNWIVDKTVKIENNNVSCSDDIKLIFDNNKISSKRCNISNEFMSEENGCSITTDGNKENIIDIYLEK